MKAPCNHLDRQKQQAERALQPVANAQRPARNVTFGAAANTALKSREAAAVPTQARAEKAEPIAQVDSADDDDLEVISGDENEC